MCRRLVSQGFRASRDITAILPNWSELLREGLLCQLQEKVLQSAQCGHHLILQMNLSTYRTQRENRNEKIQNQGRRFGGGWCWIVGSSFCRGETVSDRDVCTVMAGQILWLGPQLLKIRFLKSLSYRHFLHRGGFQSWKNLSACCIIKIK